MCASAPDGALELASVAREIADEIRIDSYPFDAVIAARAHAWREYAYVLAYVSRYPDALRAIDRAEELFRQLMPLRDFDLARTAVTRGIIYRSIDRVPEAITLTHQAADTFLTHGQRERYVNTRMTEAAMLIRQASFAEALAVCEPLEAEAALKERPAYGVLLQNIGLALREIGQIDRARDYLLRAIVEHEKHNAVAEVARTRWSFALTFVAAGELLVALDALKQSWREHEKLRLDGDAALVGLDLVEVQLLLGQPEEVPAICRTLLDQFTKSGMTSRAVTALAYLREAAAHGKATPALVRHIRDFIRDLPRHPSRPFAPPTLV